MTQPTQEDKSKVLIDILKGKVVRKTDQTGEIEIYLEVPGFPLIPYDSKWPNPYTDDSFTGALVKAVFPLLAQKGWSIVIRNDRIEIRSYAQYDGYYTQVTTSNLNTALIEAWKKIERPKDEPL